MQTMGKKFLIFLALISLSSGLAMADRSILDWIMKFAFGVSSLEIYCTSWRFNVELNNIRDFDVVPQECTEYIGKYMASSQYLADSQRAIEQCQLFLSSCCCLEGDGKDAWIFDIDDTLLSTLPYFSKHNFGGEKLNFTSLEEWMRRKEAPALEHTKRLYYEVRMRGYKIFLISSRLERDRDVTVNNLIEVGYYGWSRLILRGYLDEKKEVKHYKAEVRKQLVEEGYRLWGIVGDQWSSFYGSPSAQRTFKLPNSWYYVS